MACPASPVTYQKDPVKTLLTNVVGTHNLLEIAKRHNARLLITSTSEVYGDPLEHPQKETYWGNVNCTGIRSCYDEGKRAAETLCFDYHRTRGVDVRVARIFNTYGPRMMIDDGRIVSNFVAQALQGIPLTLYGSGNQTRSFCYIEDQVNGLYKLMNQNNTIGPVNIGNPDEFTVLELAEKVKKLVGGNVQFEFKPLPSDDPKQRKPDISKAKKDLDWEPKIKLDEGLQRTIKDFRVRLGDKAKF
jgi:UDP-glucuronate decarboxylase